jgi:hypothetical protein
MNGSLRRVARNFIRWKDEAMIRRWVALGIADAQKGFRRVKGYGHMPPLVAALRPAAATVASEEKVAQKNERRDYPELKLEAESPCWSMALRMCSGVPSSILHGA